MPTMSPQTEQRLKEGKEAKQRKKKIGVRSMVTAKVGEKEEKTRVGRSRRVRKEVMGYV